MEFDKEKCAMLIMSSGKRKMSEGIELPNQEKIKILEEKETYKYFECWKLTPSNTWRGIKKVKKSIS